MSDKVRLALDARAELGEGPVWCPDRQALFWVDILGTRFHRFDPATGEDRALALAESVSAFALREDGAGAVAATENGVAWLDVETGALTPICEAETDRPETRFNDGKCDREGRFWAGTMHRDSLNEGAGNLYRFDIESNMLISVRGGIGVFNGPAWSPDGATFYHADSPTGLIHAYDYDSADGEISNPRVFAEPDAALGLDANRRAEYPAAGGILAFEPGVTGVPEPRLEG